MVNGHRIGGDKATKGEGNRRKESHLVRLHWLYGKATDSAEDGGAPESMAVSRRETLP